MIFWYSQIEINSLIYVWISCIEKQWEINVSITNKEQDLHMQKKKKMCPVIQFYKIN